MAGSSLQPRAKEGRRACENERVAAKKRGRRNGEEVTPSAYVCKREGERERCDEGRDGKRKTDMAGMMEDGRTEHELILGI